MRQTLPTVAMNAFWTALEALVDLNKEIIKNGDACPECRNRPSRTQDAILELIESILEVPAKEKEQIASVLSEVRKEWRIAWVHRGSLTGRDFESDWEVWFAHRTEEVPGWSRAEYLLSQMEDFVRQIIVSFLEQVSEKPSASTDNLEGGSVQHSAAPA